jgi:cell division protein ZapE
MPTVGSGPVLRLVDRSPEVSPDELVAGLAPPPLFSQAGFDTYLPDADEPS